MGGRWQGLSCGLLALVWCGASLGSAARTAEELADLENSVEYAFYTEDARMLSRLLEGAAALAASADPQQRYQLAHAAFRRLQLAVRGHDAPAAAAAGELCFEALEGVPDADARAAEAYVLKAACAAYLARNGGLRALAQSRRIDGWLARALELAPDNPRVRLTRALVYWYRGTPRAEQRSLARRDFEAATAGFDAPGTAVAGAPSWGAADAWLFVGRGCAYDGDLIGARSAYEKALLIAPDFVAARRALAGLALTP